MARLLTIILFLCLSVPALAAEPGFQDDFKGSLRVMPDGSKQLLPDPSKWAFTFWPGIKWKDSYGNGTNWLDNNGESQTYCDPLRSHIAGKPIPGELRCNPFYIDEQGLHIKAFKLTPDQIAAYQVGGHRRFGSGMILSRYHFQYGKVTMIAKLPAAKGTWPALWLLPKKETWPPEIDIFEVMAWGDHKSEIHSGVLSTDKDRKYPGDWFDVDVDPSEDFHEYTLDWTKDEMSVSFDGKELWRTKTPPDLHQPMYVIANLAIGGKWVGNELGIKPIDSKTEERLSRVSDVIETDLPAEMIIKQIQIEPY